MWGTRRDSLSWVAILPPWGCLNGARPPGPSNRAYSRSSRSPRPCYHPHSPIVPGSFCLRAAGLEVLHVVTGLLEKALLSAFSVANKPPLPLWTQEMALALFKELLPCIKTDHQQRSKGIFQPEETARHKQAAACAGNLQEEMHSSGEEGRTPDDGAMSTTPNTP